MLFTLILIIVVFSIRKRTSHKKRIWIGGKMITRRILTEIGICMNILFWLVCLHCFVIGATYFFASALPTKVLSKLEKAHKNILCFLLRYYLWYSFLRTIRNDSFTSQNKGNICLHGTLSKSHLWNHTSTLLFYYLWYSYGEGKNRLPLVTPKWTFSARIQIMNQTPGTIQENKWGRNTTYTNLVA